MKLNSKYQLVFVLFVRFMTEKTMHIQIFKKSGIYHFKNKSGFHCCHDRSSYNLHILYFVIIWLHIVHISQETRIFHVSFIFHYDSFIGFQQMIYQCYQTNLFSSG